MALHYDMIAHSKLPSRQDKSSHDSPQTSKSFLIRDILDEKSVDTKEQNNDTAQRTASPLSNPQQFLTFPPLHRLPSMEINSTPSQTGIIQYPFWMYSSRLQPIAFPAAGFYNPMPCQRARKPGTMKKRRQLFSSHQVERLEKEFETSSYITAIKRVELSAQLRLTETQIKTWFQNRRTKVRKEIQAHMMENTQLDLFSQFNPFGVPFLDQFRNNVPLSCSAPLTAPTAVGYQTLPPESSWQMS